MVFASTSCARIWTLLEQNYYSILSWLETYNLIWFQKREETDHSKFYVTALTSNIDNYIIYLVSSYCIQRILVACMKGNNLSEFIFSFSYFLFSQAWFSSQAQFILRRLDPRIPTSSPFLTVSGGRWSQWPPLDTAIWRMEDFVSKIVHFCCLLYRKMPWDTFTLSLTKSMIQTSSYLLS